MTTKSPSHVNVVSILQLSIDSLPSDQVPNEDHDEKDTNQSTTDSVVWGIISIRVSGSVARSSDTVIVERIAVTIGEATKGTSGQGENKSWQHDDRHLIEMISTVTYDCLKLLTLSLRMMTVMIIKE